MFSVSKGTYFVTISDEEGKTVLASGTRSVTYTPTTTGVIRFYSHVNENCDEGNPSFDYHYRMVKCGDIKTPTSCGDFVMPSNIENKNAGFFRDKNQSLAIDIPMGNSAFTLYGLEPKVVGIATSFSFVFYTDNNGVPGTQIATRNGIIKESVITGSFGPGLEIYKNTVEFDSPIDFAANTKYWIAVDSDALAWESTPNGELGSKDAFKNDDTSGEWQNGPSDYVFNLLCGSLSVDDMITNKFSYYPNPVKDYLTINSNKAVKTVEIYNITGQKMNVATKLVNGKVNMSSLTPGTYLINITFEDGKNESLKVIKK